jgi:hypothetical protein
MVSPKVLLLPGAVSPRCGVFENHVHASVSAHVADHRARRPQGRAFVGKPVAAMKPIIDPREGDVEDDASSTKRRSLFSLAGSLLAEVSLPKLVLAWILLIGLPGVILGVAPLIASLWLSAASSKVLDLLTGITPVLLLAVLIGIAWFGGRPLLRLIESSFWSLNALGVQPAYIFCREGLRQVAEQLLPQNVSAAGRA